VTDKKTNRSYADLSVELNAIIEELQSNNLDVDHVLNRYERGTKVIAELEKYLNEAENRVNKLSVKPSRAKT
jgi:exodeoxyribonuclease VII small subunit